MAEIALILTVAVAMSIGFLYLIGCMWVEWRTEGRKIEEDAARLMAYNKRLAILERAIYKALAAGDDATLERAQAEMLRLVQEVRE